MRANLAIHTSIQQRQQIIYRLQWKHYLMQYQGFVQSHLDHFFVASVVGMPNLSVEGATEAEAIPTLLSYGSIAASNCPDYCDRQAD